MVSLISFFYVFLNKQKSFLIYCSNRFYSKKLKIKTKTNFSIFYDKQELEYKVFPSKGFHYILI